MYTYIIYIYLYIDTHINIFALRESSVAVKIDTFDFSTDILPRKALYHLVWQYTRFENTSGSALGRHPGRGYVVDRKEGFRNRRYVNQGNVDTTGFSCYIAETLYNFTSI